MDILDQIWILSFTVQKRASWSSGPVDLLKGTLKCGWQGKHLIVYIERSLGNKPCNLIQSYMCYSSHVKKAIRPITFASSILHCTHVKNTTNLGAKRSNGFREAWSWNQRPLEVFGFENVAFASRLVHFRKNSSGICTTPWALLRGKEDLFSIAFGHLDQSRIFCCSSCKLIISGKL